MRFKTTKGNFTVYAITGTHTVAFGIDCPSASMKDLLGFAVEKEQLNNNGEKERVYLMGFKVFKDRIESPVPGALYSTYDNPIQGFTWEDFGVTQNKEYIYYFHPLYGRPRYIHRKTEIKITVTTEADYKPGDHSVFFNRGVASSQAYTRKFGNKKPSQVPDHKAYQWLSHGLEENLLKFINDTQNGDELYGCFYEFHYAPVLDALKEALDRGVKVQFVYDDKDNAEKFPKEDNEEAIDHAHLNDPLIAHPRTANKSYISHNKFMVLVHNNQPAKVWTGSTNISEGGIFGQTNVGHMIEDAGAAATYLKYWNAIKADPTSTIIKNVNETLLADLNVANIPNGVSCIFSPRKSNDMLDFYAQLLDSAQSNGFITLAFGVNQRFQDLLLDNTAHSPLTFLMLEKDDADIANMDYQHNLVKAVGSYIKDDTLYKWVRETNTQFLGLNAHALYIHSKFLLKDPLSNDPVVVTGSANFSEGSTTQNDENMLIIRGNTRVGDIYFTEFMRIFNHYYFRWVVNQMKDAGNLDGDNAGFLDATDKWTEPYKKGSLKRKRVELFVNGQGYVQG